MLCSTESHAVAVEAVYLFIVIVYLYAEIDMSMLVLESVRYKANKQETHDEAESIRSIQI
jgi:hypothetical protein